MKRHKSTESTEAMQGEKFQDALEGGDVRLRATAELCRARAVHPTYVSVRRSRQATDLAGERHAGGAVQRRWQDQLKC